MLYSYFIKNTSDKEVVSNLQFLNKSCKYSERFMVLLLKAFFGQYTKP
ncbi:MAG: hypothetical protein ACI924_002046 [Flavobacterium sp.]|jgi:hypothetical protein